MCGRYTFSLPVGANATISDQKVVNQSALPRGESGGADLPGKGGGWRVGPLLWSRYGGAPTRGYPGEYQANDDSRSRDERCVRSFGRSHVAASFIFSWVAHRLTRFDAALGCGRLCSWVHAGFHFLSSVNLMRIELAQIDQLCSIESYTQEQAVVPTSAVKTVMARMTEVKRAMDKPFGDGFELKHAMFTVLQAALAVSPNMKIERGYLVKDRDLDMSHVIGLLEFSGCVDFMVSDGERFVCVVAPKEAEKPEDYDDYYHERESPSDLAKRKTETGIAHAAFVSEIFKHSEEWRRHRVGLL